MSDSNRDEQGRFLPGNSGGPGRPTKLQEKAVLDAVKAAFSPEEIAKGLRDAFDLAKKQGSTRGMLAALELAVVYSVGKPKQSVSIGANNSNEFLIALLEDRTPLLPPRQGIIETHPPRLIDKDD